MTDDASLLQEYIAKGSEDAFREVVARYVDLVFAAALPRVGGAFDLAEDVAQRVFIDLARKASVLSTRSELSGWLYTATRFIAADLVRSERRRKHRELAAADMNEMLDQNSEFERWDRLRPLLFESIDALKPVDRDAVVMRFFSRRPFSEIGKHLNLSDDAAQKRVDRALEALRSKLAKSGITSTTAAVALALGDQVQAVPAGVVGQIAVHALAHLSAASTTVSLTSNITLFMSSKTAMTVSGALFLLGLGWAVSESLQVAQLRTAVEASQRESAALGTRAGELKQTEQNELNQSARLTQSFDELKRLIAAASPPIDRYANGRRFLADHPEVRPMIREYKHALAHGWPVRAARAAGFSDEQVKQYAEMFEHQSGVAFRVDDVQLPDDEGTLTIDEAQLSGLKALVGPELYAKYRAYMDQGGAEIIAAGVTQVANDLGTPITPAQSHALLPLLAGDQQAVDWNAATQQATQILTQGQIAAWNAEKAVWVNMRAQNEYASSATKAAQAGTP
jgi:RNA polymerase sigma factor (sigma-70 family)